MSSRGRVKKRRRSPSLRINTHPPLSHDSNLTKNSPSAPKQGAVACVEPPMTPSPAASSIPPPGEPIDDTTGTEEGVTPSPLGQTSAPVTQPMVGDGSVPVTQPVDDRAAPTTTASSSSSSKGLSTGEAVGVGVSVSAVAIVVMNFPVLCF